MDCAICNGEPDVALADRHVCDVAVEDFATVRRFMYSSFGMRPSLRRNGMPHLAPKPSFNAQSMIGAEPVFMPA
jgi:hypothetical protein